MPAAYELAPRPRDPVPGPAADAFALLFLPPALSLVYPALYLPASILVLLTPARNSVSLLPPCPPPSPPDGDNDVDNQRSVDAMMDLSPEDDRRQATQSQSALLSSLPPRMGGGCRTQRLVTPGIMQLLGQVPPHGHPSSSAAGGSPAVAVGGRGGSGGGVDTGGGVLVCVMLCWFFL